MDTMPRPLSLALAVVALGLSATPASGASTLLPAGEYVSNQTLQMYSNTTLRGDGATSIDYRPVHAYTMSNEIQYIEPKARVY